MIARLFQDNIEMLRPIAESWRDEANTAEFNITTDMNAHLYELQAMMASPMADLLVLYDGEAPVGYMGLQYFKSPIGTQIMANEHLFYVLPDKRSVSSMKLLELAKTCAKIRGCSHIIFNASKLASGLHDKVCNLYERMKMKKFETSYIVEVN